jgi:hypothetical protein
MPREAAVLEIDGGAVILIILAIVAAFFAWRYSSKRKSMARATQADSLERLVSHLHEFAAQRRDTDAALAYIASEIELFREREKL